MYGINKETVIMNYLFNSLYEINDEEDFTERLKDELQEDHFKKILNSVDDKTRKMFEEPFSISEIKERIKEANDIFEKTAEKMQAELKGILEVFENSDFLKSFFTAQDNFFLEFQSSNSSVYIEEFSDSVLRRITFENSEICLNGNALSAEKIEIYYDTVRLIEENGSYILEIVNYITDECYTVKFDNISVLLKAYNAESDYLFWFFISTPWDYVISLANNINAHFRYKVATQSERKIFGLVKHLIGEKYLDADTVPAELYHLIEKHNLRKYIPSPYDLTKAYLCQKKYEPFWRDILNLISESQKDLPSYFEETVSKDDFENHKNIITAEMESYGYSGTYPDFYKEDSIIKPTLLKTYNLSYIVAFEKYAQHHIHCYSFGDNGVIHTTFFVGTVFQKKSNVKSDIYSTMFNRDGKAVFSILSTINAGEMSKETYEFRTKNAIKAAVKKAELKKFDKEDNKFKSVFERGPVLNFRGIILAFVLFALGFSFIVPLLLIFLEGSTIPEVITFLKSEPILLSVGVVGGAVATGLFVLVEWIGSKK